MKKLIATLLILASPGIIPTASSQKTVGLAYGNFDRWTVREIKESGVIGGNVRYLYEIAPGDTIKGDIPYRRSSQSPWRTCHVLAKVHRIT